MPRLFIGTSGWNYAGWAHGFYRGVPRKHWLEHAASQFSGLEVNGTFYRQQRPEVLAEWARRTPPEFAFAVKGHRFITHHKKLIDIADPVARQRAQARGLGDKLAAVLWQLPRNFARHDERLRAFLRELSRWDTARHAIELRHRSWFDADVAAMLGDAAVAVCLSDAADWPMWDAVTTDLVYVRLHGHTRTYRSAYSSRSLERWAERVRCWLREGREVHVYFDNDGEGAAPRDALRLRALCADLDRRSPHRADSRHDAAASP